MRFATIMVALVACTEPAPATGELAQAASVCADGPTTYGIDVSRFQGTIDWQKVADSGVKFAWIQVSRSLTDVDAKFDYNWQHAKQAGILRGAYQRFHPGQDVAGQADLFLAKLGTPVAGDLPPMLDVEDADGLSGTQIAAAVRKWMDRVEPVVGVKPVIYTGFYFWRDSVGSADFSEHPLWIANYGATCPLVPDAWTRWAFHQYSSSAMVPGITENTTDVDKFNGTLAELQALAAAPVCGDGTCSSLEDADSCPVECEPCQRISAVSSTEDVIDDTGACFVGGGNPQFLRTATDAGIGGSLRWTHATDLAAPSNYAVWNLYFDEAGRYRVEVSTPAPYNQSKQTVYRVHAGDTTTDVSIDQSAVDGWQSLGELDFVAGGHGQSIRLNDNTGEANSTNTQIVFDAVRVTRVDAPPGGDPGEPDPADGGGGCNAARPGIGALFALLAFARPRRRRRS